MYVLERNDDGTSTWTLGDNEVELPEGWFLVSPMWTKEQDR